MTRTTQERIAGFPAAILVDLQHLGCEARFGLVKPGEQGYTPLYAAPELTLSDLEEFMCQHYACRPATVAERAAAQFGSMFGWDKPGADPEYHEQRRVTCIAG